jgi:hypothetical protein
MHSSVQRRKTSCVRYHAHPNNHMSDSARCPVSMLLLCSHFSHLAWVHELRERATLHKVAHTLLYIRLQSPVQPHSHESSPGAHLHILDTLDKNQVSTRVLAKSQIDARRIE